MTHAEQNAPTPACPYSPSLHAGHDSLEAAAQSFIDTPDSSADIVRGLVDQQEHAYHLMLRHNPAKANVAIARKVRAAYRGPGALAINSTIVNQLHHMTTTEREAFVAIEGSGTLDYSTLFVNARYHGVHDTWMKVMFSLLDKAMDDVDTRQPSSRHIQQAQASTQGLVYGRLADAYAHQPSLATWSTKWRTRTLLLDTLQGSIENNAALHDVLLAGHLAITSSMRETPDANYVAQMLHANIQTLASLASINRATIRNIAANPNGTQSAHIGMRQDTERLGNIFRFDDGMLRPVHPSLRKGPWKVPGNCAGRLGMRLPEQGLASSVQAFFESVGHPEHGIDAEGKIQPITLLLGAGIEIGRHTIFLPQHNLLRPDVSSAVSVL